MLSLSSKKKIAEKQEKNWFFHFSMIFIDFVSKITAFVKKTPAFFRIQKNLSKCKPNNSGTYILKWFVFSSRQMWIWTLTSFFYGEFWLKFSRNIIKNPLLGALFGFDCQLFCFKTSVTHILLPFCVFLVKILLIFEIWGPKMAKN